TTTRKGSMRMTTMTTNPLASFRPTPACPPPSRHVSGGGRGPCAKNSMSCVRDWAAHLGTVGTVWLCRPGRRGHTLTDAHAGHRGRLWGYDPEAQESRCS